MSNEKEATPYPEPPPPYSSAPSVGVAAGRNIFQGPMHPPPPGGVPVFPMAPGYNQPTAQTVVVSAPTGTPSVQAVTVVNVSQCGPYPMQVACPHCGAHVMSETTAIPGLLTWLLAGGLLMLGCWAGCCLIPCCIPECQDIEHRCPNCKQHLGTFRRFN